MKDLTRHFADRSRASLALSHYAHDDDEQEAQDAADTERSERFGRHDVDLDDDETL